MHIREVVDTPVGKLPSPLGRFGVEVAYAVSAPFARQLVSEMVSDAGEDGLIALDTETAPLASEVARLEALALSNSDEAFRAALRRSVKAAALHPRRAEVRLVQLYAGGKRVAVLDMRRVSWDVLKPLQSCSIATHNAGLDLALLMHQGIEPIEVYCAMQAVRLLRGHGRAGLTEAARHYLNVEWDDTLQKSDWSVNDLTMAQRTYAANNAVATWHLAEEVLCHLGDRANAYEIQMAAVVPAIRMQMRGVLPDLAAHSELVVGLKAVLPKFEEAYLAACDKIGRPDLRERGAPNTPAKVEALLEEILSDRDYDNWERTPKRHLSTGKDQLAIAKADYPPIRALIDIKRIRKQLDTYGESWRLFIDPDSGRIHSTFNINAAITGRASCERPNLQQLPKRQPIPGLASFRSLIVPSPGCVFVGADYDQMEMRIAAAVSGDVAMTADLAKGLDLHKATAALLLGIDINQVTDEQRGFGKTVNFAQLYGQGWAGLIRRLRVLFGIKIGRTQAEEYRRRFRQKYPQFAARSDRQVRMCNAQRVIPISSGRAYEYAWGKPDAYHNNQAINLPIQGQGADIAMIASAKIEAALRRAGIRGGMVIWNHDEFLLEVVEADAERASELLKEAMETAFLEVLPGAPTLGLVSVKRGRTWADLK